MIGRVDEIKVIKAAEPLSIRDTRVRLRVCAYCRVPTDNIEQRSSFELQKVYYDEYIGKHENWSNTGKQKEYQHYMETMKDKVEKMLDIKVSSDTFIICMNKT